MAEILMKVDSPYEKGDGSQGFVFGMTTVDDASDESARSLVDEGKAQYVNEEDQEAHDKAVAEESDKNVESAVDESLRASSSLGQKFGDAFASNNAPAGDTAISDPTGESGVQAKPVDPAFRLGAEANTRRQPAEEESSDSEGAAGLKRPQRSE